MDVPRQTDDRADIRRWHRNRALANDLDVRDLETTWGTPANSIAAALELLNLWGTLHGWPPPDDPVDARDDLVVWDRFARLRRPFIR